MTKDYWFCLFIHLVLCFSEHSYDTKCLSVFLSPSVCQPFLVFSHSLSLSHFLSFSLSFHLSLSISLSLSCSLALSVSPSWPCHQSCFTVVVFVCNSGNMTALSLLFVSIFRILSSLFIYAYTFYPWCLVDLFTDRDMHVYRHKHTLDPFGVMHTHTHCYLRTQCTYTVNAFLQNCLVVGCSCMQTCGTSTCMVYNFAGSQQNGHNHTLKSPCKFNL